MRNTVHTPADEKYMSRCLELAQEGRGQVSPNPLVGAVIVRNNRVIGEGRHRRYGGPHAEAEAINNATEPVEGATLYCNLEPCCHTRKQTPPCTPLIINHRIGRVVIANTDPNPAVSGKGLEQLRAAGIEVCDGVLAGQGRELNRFYFKHVRTGRPWVTLKIAQSMDGRISLERGRQTWITGEESQRYVHARRSVYDAVMVGAGTVRADDPELTVRLTEGRNPVRIVLDGRMRAPAQARVFTDHQAPTWLITSRNPSTKMVHPEGSETISWIQLEGDSDDRIDPDTILLELGKRRINSLFIEGGQELFSQFLSQDLYDDVIILQHPVLFGRGLGSVSLNGDVSLNVKSVETIGADVKFECRNPNRSYD